MFFSQTLIGLLICFLILSITIFYIIMALKLKGFYEGLIADLKFNEKNNSCKFKVLQNEEIYNAFKKAKEKGTVDINTQVIISQGIPIKIKTMENLLMYLQSMVIVFGLLGTFIGLTGSIANIKAVIDSLQGSGVTIDNFLNKMTMPLSTMSTAFFTSISGIAASMVLKIVSIFTFRSIKDSFYDSMEGYLDNYVYCENSMDYGKLIFEQSKNMNIMVRNMCDNLMAALERSLEGFSKNVSKVSTSLVSSGRELDVAVTKISTSMEEFNKPVALFNESTKDFNIHYNGVNGQVVTLQNAISTLNHGLEKYSKVIKENSEYIYNSKLTLPKEGLFSKLKK